MMVTSGFFLCSWLIAYKTTWESAAQFTYNHSTLTTLTSVRESTGWFKSNFLTTITTLKCICNDSTDVLCIVVARWSGQLPIRLQFLIPSHNHGLSSLYTYATKVPTLCLKQPTFILAEIYSLVLLRLGTRLTVAVQQSYNSYYSYNQDAAYGMPTFI